MEKWKTVELVADSRFWVSGHSIDVPGRGNLWLQERRNFHRGLGVSTNSNLFTMPNA